jgi:hypothetical protein
MSKQKIRNTPTDEYSMVENLKMREKIDKELAGMSSTCLHT